MDYKRTALQIRGLRLSQLDVLECLAIFADYQIQWQRKRTLGRFKKKKNVGGQRLTMIKLIQKQMDIEIHSVMVLAQDRKEGRKCMNEK